LLAYLGVIASDRAAAHLASFSLLFLQHSQEVRLRDPNRLHIRLCLIIELGATIGDDVVLAEVAALAEFFGEVFLALERESDGNLRME
jgi:hypothetical protein